MTPVNNKRPVESFLVALPSTTLRTTGNVSTTTGPINLSNGQLGFASDSPYGTVAANAFLATTATIDAAPIIRLYQGTPDSAAPAQTTYKHPLASRPFEVSAPINGKTNVVVTKQAYRAGRNAVWSVGAGSGSGVITPAADTLYTVKVALSGYRVEEFFSEQQAVGFSSSVTTPAGSAYTALTSPTDWLVKNLVYEINLNSGAFLTNVSRRGRAPIVAIAVSDTAGTLISSLTAGSTLTVMNTTSGVRSILLTSEILAGLTAAATATGLTRVVTTDLSTAGAAADAEGLYIVALDPRTAYIDYIVNLRNSIRVGLTDGFASTVSSTLASKPDEGQGQGRTLDLLYRATQGQRKYNLRHTSDMVNPEYPSPVVTTTNYTTYVVHHGLSYQPDSFSSIYSPLKEIILIPDTETTLMTNVETLLNTWLASGDNQAIVSI